MYSSCITLQSSLLLDPVSVEGNLGVDTRVVGLGAPIAPGNDTGQSSVDRQWATGVTLTGVFSTFTVVGGANLSLGYASVGGVGRVTQTPGDDGHGYSLQLDRGSFTGTAPASHVGHGSGGSLLASIEQGYGFPSCVQFYGSFQLQ